MRRLTVVALVVALLLSGWAGYSWMVFTDQPDRRTVVMAGEEVAPGGQAAAHVVVTDPNSGERLEDAGVTLYLETENGSERERVASGRTGPDGSYTAEFEAPDETGTHRLVVVSEDGGVSDEVETTVTVDRSYSIVVETDRPIYRPGDDVHVRGVVRNRGGDAADGTARVEITGPNANRLFSREVSLNEYGTGNITFPISSEAPPGRYRVKVSYDGETRTRTVTVREYEKPRFDVGFSPEESYYRPGERVRATVDAEYFFGEPVTNGTVTVEGMGYVGDLRSFDTVTTTTDESGVATVDLRLPDYFAGLPSEGGKGLAVVNVSVTDEAGHTETVTRKIPIAQGELVLNAFTADGKLSPGVPNTVYVTAEYPDGRPASTEVTVSTPDGQRTVETNQYGVGTFTYTPDGNDDRRVRLRAREGGENVRNTVYFELERGNRIATTVDRGVYDVGDTLTGRVYVGKDAGTVFLDVVGEDGTVTTKTLTVENGSAEFSLAVTPAMTGNVRVRAWSIFRNNRVGADARTVLVRPEGEVNVTLAANESTYRPGDPATLTVRTTRNGSPVSAAVGVDVVDESVFAVEQRRQGLAAAHFEMEEELTQPRLFVHNYSAQKLREPAASEDERLAQRASVSRLSARPGGTAGDSYQQGLERIERRQSNVRGANGHLWTLLLVVLPLGTVGLGLRRRDPREHLADVGTGGVMLIGALLGGIVLWVVGFVVALASAGLGLVFLIGVLAGLVGIGAWLDWNLSDLGFQTVVGVAAGAYLATLLAGVGLAAAGWLEPVVALHYWWAVVPAFLLIPATFVGLGGDVRNRLYKAAVVGIAISMVLTPVIGSAFVLGIGQDQQAGGVAEERTTADMAGEGAGRGGDGGNAAGTGDDGGADDPQEVRQYFPDTLASRTVRTGPDGTASTQLGMADTITTWRVSATASTRDGDLGSARSSMEVFQPFFVKPSVPPALTKNDTVTVPVSVFNYENHTKTVEVSLRDAGWYDVDAGNATDTVTVPPDSVRRAEFTITARRTGEFPLTFVAVGEPAENASLEAHATANRTTDAVRKSVTVAPPGKTVTMADSGRISGTERISAGIPDAAVENSSKTVLRIYPGAYGQTVQGMERLLSMPTGCFEQTSSSLYPNVLVLRYMDQTGQSNPEMRMTAERYIATGYQRLLTFETSTRGGYSLFGEDPPNLVLTAYGLQEMSDMSEVYNVDERKITDMQRFLADRQRSDGSWRSDGRLEYSLGVSGDELSTTAYVTWSLAHSGYEGPEVKRGADYVRDELDVSAADTATLAVALNALASAREHPELQGRIADELESRAVVEDGTVHWERNGDSEGYRYGDKGVLTTALVANGLLESGRKAGLTNGAVDWIVEQKSGKGGWGSTQNTIMALRVLLAAQDGGEAETGTVTVERNGERVAALEVNETNRDEVRTIVLPADRGANDYRIEGPEESGLYYELSTEYNAPWEAVERRRDGGAIDMTVSYDRTNLTVDDTLELSGRITVSEGRVGTALVDLGVPPGFTVVEDSLDALVADGTISRYEVRGRQIVLYAEDVAGTREFSVRMRATQPIEAQSGSARVYDYYDPEEESVEAPVTIHVSPNDGGPTGDRSDGTTGNETVVGNGTEPGPSGNGTDGDLAGPSRPAGDRAIGTGSGIESGPSRALRGALEG